MAQFDLLRRLADHARRAPDAIAYRFVSCEEARTCELTWSQLDRSVRTCARRFASRVPARQVLLVSSANCLELPVILLAAWAAGFRAFPISSELSPSEAQRLADQSGAVAGVVGATRAAGVLVTKLNHIWRIDEIGLPGDETEFASRDGAALLLQSSGTTGFPRVVTRGAQSLDAVASAIVNGVGFTPQDRVLATLPLSHSYGIEHGLLAPVWAGSTVVLAQGLDAGVLTRELSTNGATVLPTVPGVIEILADLLESAPRMPHLRQIYSAGGPLPRSVFDRFKARYGLRVGQLYGATEVGSVTFANSDDPQFDPGSVGRPMNGVSVRVLDPIDPSRARSTGEEGHVAIRADSMFHGYVEGDTHPLADGHFLTGDLGKLDAQGRLTITGRLKLLIEIGGMKVNPLEVESVLCEHPAVGACVVVPVRQSQTVFRIKAVVTPRDPRRPPVVDELRALARERLATFKVPRVFEIRESLPTTPTGKVLRHLVDA